MKKDLFVREYTKAIQNGTAAIFAGAGFSKSAGFVDWATLLKDIAEEIDLDSSKETGNLPALAQYYENEKGNRNRLSELIRNEFCDIKEPDENHLLLSHLPIHTYWTTNYDHLIEDCLRREKKKVDVKVTEGNMSISMYGADAVVYKMHGDVDLADKTILTQREYETYGERHPLMLNALTRDFQSNTFLFLGFSFTDSNLNHIVSQLKTIAERNDGGVKTHYCIMRKPQQGIDENDADFSYRLKKDELNHKNLLKYGIEIIQVDDFNEITEILRDLNKAYYQKTVYISGAVADYGNWTKDTAERFVFKLGGSLVKNGYRIVTGYGLGIGNSVIGGVLNEVYMNKGKQLDDELIARPFPQGNDDIRAKWPAYRKDMISYTGISIFLFGNKRNQDGDIVLSDGMQQEYDISESQGNILIPVAATGGMSQSLWEQLMKQYGGEEPYKSLSKEYLAIRDDNAYKDPDKLLECILDIVMKTTL